MRNLSCAIQSRFYTPCVCDPTRVTEFVPVTVTNICDVGMGRNGLGCAEVLQGRLRLGLWFVGPTRA